MEKCRDARGRSQNFVGHLSLGHLWPANVTAPAVGCLGPRSDLRWCSDAFEIGCDNGERVRVAFALDCCDREAMSFVATTGGIGGEEVRDLMVAAVEHRFGRVNRLPRTIEWLSDNGSGYVSTETRRFARDLGLEPRTTPVR